MKNLLMSLIALSFWAVATAQVPQKLSYQAVARNAAGECLQNQTISLQVSILNGSPAGAVLYKERFEGNVQTNAVGHFQIEIGTGNVQTGGQYQNFSEIPWNNLTAFLKMEYAPGATTTFEEVGTTQLLTVPYAMVAGNGKKYSNTNQDEYITFRGKNGMANVSIGGTGDPNGDRNYGIMRIYDDEQNEAIRLWPAPSADGAGYMYFFGENGLLNIEFSVLSTANYPNNGAIRLRNDAGDNKAVLYADSYNAGHLRLYGPNGNQNVELTVNSASHPNKGAVKVFDDSGNEKASMYVSTGGAGVKAFVMPHPSKPGKEIVYASIEGPEAAAYERGTATLVNGEAEITFSETFEIVANPATMTILTSPWSAGSKGLAVTERTATGFKVKELYGGTGNYKFDWETKAVRKGLEDFKSIRDKEPDTSESNYANDASYENK
jgi:hypothetical protein